MRRSWWSWDEGGYYAWENGERAERMLRGHLTRLGAFDVHALRLRWPDGREELASYHEYMLRTERRPLRLLSTS